MNRRGIMMGFLFAHLLVLFNATVCSAQVRIVSEEVRGFECGQGAEVNVDQLPPDQTQFGIAGTGSAISARVAANSNSSAGYESQSFVQESRTGLGQFSIVIYFKPSNPSILRDINASATIQVLGGLFNSQFVSTRFNSSDAVPGANGWRSVTMSTSFPNSPGYLSASVRLNTLVQNTSNTDEKVSFGKIELLSSNGIERIPIGRMLLLQPTNCNGAR